MGEISILSLTSGKYFLLNSVGATIWTLIQEPKSLEDLRSCLLEAYDVDAERCQKDLLEWVEKLASEGLIKVTREAVGPA